MIKLSLKSLFLISLISSAFAGGPCSGNRDICMESAPWTMNGVVHALSHPIQHSHENAGVYYAKATAKTCDEAFQKGVERMATKWDFLLSCRCEHPQVRCGVNGGPYLNNQDCFKDKKGHATVWVRCDNIFHSEVLPKPGANSSGAGFVLLQSLIRDEKTHAK